MMRYKFLEKNKIVIGSAILCCAVMVMNPEVFDYLSPEERCILERTPLEALAQEGKLGIYKHPGFWQCMDTQRDKNRLESLWNGGNAPWKVGEV